LPRRRALPRWRALPGWRTRLSGREPSAAGRSRRLLARGTHPELPPELVGLRHELGLGNPAAAIRHHRARHRAQMGQLWGAELKAPAAHRAHEVVIRAVGHNGHEVEAHRLLRPDVVEEHLVMTVRAHARRDLALILRVAWSGSENQYHAVIQAGAPAQRFIPGR